MSIKIKINWDNKNVMSESVRIYRADSAFTSETLPPLLTEIVGDVYEYEDLTTIEGQTYFYMLSATLGEQEAFTECFDVVAQLGWSPLNLSTLPFFLGIANKHSTLSESLVMSFGGAGSQQEKFTAVSESGAPSLSGNLILSSDANKYLRSSKITEHIYNKSGFWGFFIVKRPSSQITSKASIFEVPLATSGGYTYPSPSINFNTSGSLLVSSRKSISDSLKTISFGGEFDGSLEMLFVEIDWVGKLMKASLNGNAIQSIAHNNNSNAYLPESTKASLLFRTTLTNNSDQKGVGLGAVLIGTNLDVPTSAEIDKLFGWAAHSFGITNKLPAGHPYKSLRPNL